MLRKWAPKLTHTKENLSEEYHYNDKTKHERQCVRLGLENTAIHFPEIWLTYCGIVTPCGDIISVNIGLADDTKSLSGPKLTQYQRGTMSSNWDELCSVFHRYRPRKMGLKIMLLKLQPYLRLGVLEIQMMRIGLNSPLCFFRVVKASNVVLQRKDIRFEFTVTQPLLETV